MLGPLAVWDDDGEPIRVPEGKLRALLASLLLAEGHAVSADRLADDLWGQDLPGNPVNTLQTKVSQLRRTLGGTGTAPSLVHGPSGYVLTVPAEAFDVTRFRALVRQARPGIDPVEKVRVLSEALSLWRGEALADFAGEPFAVPFAAKLGEDRLGAREELAAARLELGEATAIVDELGVLAERYPLRERVRALHLRALYQAGRQAEALRGYRDVRSLLAGELGLEPGPELRELHAAMLRQDPALLARRAPARRPPLPVPLTELVGRDDAVRTVTGLLATHRLVTLTGPGGVGKTRLATAAATVMDGAGTTPEASEASDGVWLVELAGIDRHTCAEVSCTDQGAWVLDTIAGVLGVRDLPSSGEVAERAARLAEAVRGRDMLLVLDNCELVVESVAEVTAALLRTAPSLRILATSRQPLGIAGELVWPVPPLGIPSGVHAEGDATETTVAAIREFSAVRLFTARAAEAAPGFALAPANAAAVAAICRRLDGLPLALELAATKLRALGIDEVLVRLDDRFRLLDSGHRDAPARQRTLRALIDWSWELLDEAERTVLGRLAVHAESCDIEAAEAVCAANGLASADVTGVLARLVDRSLVVSEHTGDGPRYRLLESIAEYCLDRLDAGGELSKARIAHARHFAAVAAESVTGLRGAHQEQWLSRLSRDEGNLRTAMDTLASRGQAGLAGLALELAGDLAWYWLLRGRLGEARRRLRSTLALDGAAEHADARAAVLAWLTGFDLLSGEHAGSADRGADDGAAAAMAITDPAARGRALWFLGYALATVGDPERGERLTREALELFRASGDRWGAAAALCDLTTYIMASGQLDAAREAAEESAAVFAELGDGWGRCRPCSRWARSPGSSATTRGPGPATSGVWISRGDWDCGPRCPTSCPGWAGSSC